MRSCWLVARISKTRVKMVRGGAIRKKSHLGHVGDTQNKAYRVEDVGLARPVEARDSIERRIPSRNLRSDRI